MVLLGSSPVPSVRFRKDIDKAGCPRPGVPPGELEPDTTRRGLEIGIRNFLSESPVPRLVLDSCDQESLRYKGHGKAGRMGPETKHFVNH